MGYVVCHYDKGKKGLSGGLTHHIDRTQKMDSPNIESDLSVNNFELVELTGSIDEMAKARIEQGYKGEKAIRKDAVTSCRFILSGSHEEMVKMSKEELAEWAYDNYRFFADRHGEENIIRAAVHLDEKTPHMHLIVVPLTSDGRLSAKDFYGKKEQLRQLQDDYAKVVGNKYGLERGREGSGKKHVLTKDFYKYIDELERESSKVLKQGHAQELVTKLMEENPKIQAKQEQKLQEITHKQDLGKHHYGIKQGFQKGYNQDTPSKGGGL